MNNKLISYWIVMTGLILVLLSGLIFLAIIIIVPQTLIVGTGEISGILIALIYVFGGFATFFLFAVGITFILIHIRRRKNHDSTVYLKVLLSVSIVALALNSWFLFEMLSRISTYETVSDFAKLTIGASLSGMVLPFGIITCGNILSLAFYKKQYLLYLKLSHRTLFYHKLKDNYIR